MTAAVMERANQTTMSSAGLVTTTRDAGPSSSSSHQTAADALSSGATPAWREAYSDALRTLLTTPSGSHGESALRLSTLVRTGLLQFTDLRHCPEKFFEAHRLLVNHGFEQGPGFSIRFTVQYNLFAGTILELGGPTHLAALEHMQAEGTLGCFALTERFAGVNSGLVVNTVAEWQPVSKTFTLHTPNDGAVKNWISQGLNATKAVVMADLRIGSKSFGPHAFLMDLRNDGAHGPVTSGVTLGDMGTKTTGNDLDNAWIHFNRVELPRTALLDRHCAVTDDGTYVSKGESKLSNMELIGQRLFTGRLAVAQGAHEFRKRLFARTKAHTDAKQCWAPAGASPPLSAIPQLAALYTLAAAQEARMDVFLHRVEEAFCVCLRSGSRPPVSLVEAVAAAKVKAVEDAIELSHRLRQETGSYALMAKTGFEHTDFLQCCKFAEGDSRILMLKMARDRLRSPAPHASIREKTALDALKKALSTPEGVSVASKQELWDRHWVVVYQLAHAAMEGVVTQWVGAPTEGDGEYPTHVVASHAKL